MDPRPALQLIWANGITIPIGLWSILRGDVIQRLPEEACGLIAGKDGLATAVAPITNSLHSPFRFQMDPREQVARMLEFESIGQSLLAIYHSHPQGPATPSGTDIALSAYPEAVNLIVSPANGEWQCRGFIIHQGVVREIPVHLQTLE